MQQNWIEYLPRLYELYLDSDTNSSTNYFNKFTDELYRQDVRLQYEKLEQVLQQLNDNAWKELKHKACKYVTAKHSCRAYEQLFNTLSEAKGYLYLKSEGCTKIHFIPEKDTPTPDLRGRCDGKEVLMEVKSINPSDDELKWINNNSDLSSGRMTARKGHIGVPISLKRKITNTINTAKVQLNNYAYGEVQRAVIFLVIKLDILASRGSRNIAELDEFIRKQNNEQFEVKYCFRGS